ncbi:hypothetical protein FACS1894171_1480 [Clostridia bacterium]|nr:hypothetical protein FACS1894171_1480 [Clostridia bacterium]
MNFFVARQPIFDSKMRVYAYELLYRSAQYTNSFNEELNPDMASSEIMIESFLSMGIDKLTGDKRAFVNFTEALLKQNVATLFPKQSLVVELLETIDPTDEVIEASKLLKRNGYTLALDDFVLSEEYMPLVEIADIIKIDFLLSSLEEIKEIIARVDTKKTRLLAEKIETQEMFDLAKELGFAYFQGYFFSRPVILSDRKLSPLKFNYLNLMRYVNRPEMDFGRVASAIRHDMSLSYKLLRLVNSAYFGFRNEIKDIKHALSILGTNEIKKWVSLISMMGIQDGKPDEIIRMSMIRARFLELMGAEINLGASSENLYLTGLFSLIDVITEHPKEEILEQLYLPDIITKTLLENTGSIARALELIVHYERGCWDEAMKLATSFGIGGEYVIRYYFNSVTWCNSLIIG